MSKDKGYSLRAAAKLAGVPTMTFHGWKEKGLITPDLTDDKGNFLFSEMMIERAKEIDAKRKARKSADNSGNLFEDILVTQALPASTADTTSDTAQIDSTTAAQNDLATNGEPETLPTNVGIEGTAAENDSETFAPMSDNQNEKINSDASKNSGDLSNGEVNPLEKENAVDVIEVPAPVELSETPTTLDLAPASNVTIEMPPFIEDMKGPLEEKTLQELANEGRLCFERGDDCLKQGAMYYVEGGRRLIEAKRRLKHGQWQKWLSENFPFSQDTAENRMKLAERIGDTAESETFRNLRLATLIKLLALPAGDETAFVEAQSEAGKPIEDLSAREVQKAVAQWNQQREAKKTATFSSSEKTNNGGKIAAVVVAPCVEEESISDETAPDEEFKKLPPIAYNRNSTTDWHTPFEYIEAARIVLGGIDLDPASSELANQTVKAAKYFTADDNGLNHEWHGRIWLNPPYSSGLIEKFVDKLLASTFDAAVVLTDNATETRWFKRLADNSSAIVFTTGRINFFKGGTQEAGSPTRGQTFFYFGSAPDRFFATFQQFGWCAKKIIPSIIEATLGGDSDDDR